MSIDGQPEGRRLLDRYFDELGEALGAEPKDRRNQLIDEIREHVNNAITVQRPDSVWELRELLQKVGSPKEIAAAAFEEEGLKPQRRTRLLPLAVAGSIVLTVLGIGVLVSNLQPVRSSLRAKITTANQPAKTSAVSTTTTVPQSSTTTVPSSDSSATVPPPATPTLPPSTTTTTPSVGPPARSGSVQTVSASNMPLVASCVTGTPATSGPAMIFFGCATSSVYVDQIAWTSWTAGSATGSGTLHVNRCQPTCAQGTYDTYQATIKLWNPDILIGSQPLFQNASVVTTLQGPVETGTWPTGDWGYVPAN